MTKWEAEAVAKSVLSRYPEGKEKVQQWMVEEIAAVVLNAWQDGANQMLDSVRGSLKGWPELGGDVEVMEEVERIRKEGVREGLRGIEDYKAEMGRLRAENNELRQRVDGIELVVEQAREQERKAAHRMWQRALMDERRKSNQFRAALVEVREALREVKDML
jgi:hypothetical protein